MIRAGVVLGGKHRDHGGYVPAAAASASVSSLTLGLSPSRLAKMARSPGLEGRSHQISSWVTRLCGASSGKAGLRPPSSLAWEWSPWTTKSGEVTVCATPSTEFFDGGRDWIDSRRPVGTEEDDHFGEPDGAVAPSGLEPFQPALDLRRADGADLAIERRASAQRVAVGRVPGVDGPAVARVSRRLQVRLGSEPLGGNVLERLVAFAGIDPCAGLVLAVLSSDPVERFALGAECLLDPILVAAVVGRTPTHLPTLHTLRGLAGSGIAGNNVKGAKTLIGLDFGF
jgi:hypothetical protein